MNKVLLHGRLARDVELRYTQAGTAVASTSVAVNRRASKDGEKKADFIPLVIWGKLAETMNNYTQKGSEVLVSGRIEIRSYMDKNDNKRFITEVVVDSFDFCGSKSGNAGALVAGMEDVQPLPEGAGSFGTVASADEEIPF